MRLNILLPILVALLLSHSPFATAVAVAQETEEEEDGGAAESEAEAAEDGDEGEMAGPPAPPTPETPYDDRLARLGEIVGSIQYLRELCDSEDDHDWRAMLRELIDAEAPEPDRKARLTAAFNRGYRAFSATYNECTPQAVGAEARYRSEGATLASEIIARFGN